jgi:hypothetical protein
MTPCQLDQAFPYWRTPGRFYTPQPNHKNCETQNNYIQQNDTQHNNPQRIKTQYNASYSIATLSIVTLSILTLVLHPSAQRYSEQHKTALRHSEY